MAGLGGQAEQVAWASVQTAIHKDQQSLTCHSERSPRGRRRESWITVLRREPPSPSPGVDEKEFEQGGLVPGCPDLTYPDMGRPAQVLRGWVGEF